jgi:hypothetical protein
MTLVHSDISEWWFDDFEKMKQFCNAEFVYSDEANLKHRAVDTRIYMALLHTALFTNHNHLSPC